MKIMYISVNHELANNMHQNTFNSFAEAMDVTYYGPGYTSDEELEKGLLVYYKEHGGYDAVICNFDLIHMSVDDFPIREIQTWENHWIKNYSYFQAIRIIPDIVRDLEKIDTVKIIMIGLDYNTLTEKMYIMLQKLLNNGYYFLASGEEYMPDYFENTTNGSISCTDNYRKLVCEFRRKVISMSVVSVTNSEYCFTDLSKREYDFSVPGNMNYVYKDRYEVNQILNNAGFSVFENYKNREFGYDMGTKYPSMYSTQNVSYEQIAAWREEFHRSLCNVRCGYVGFDVAPVIVRKHYEIPARGAILVCGEAQGLSAVGFKDDYNAVVVNRDNIIEKCKSLFENPLKMQEIARRGQRLVIEKHTAYKHAINVRSAIEAIIAGKFNGSHWENGEFILD